MNICFAVVVGVIGGMAVGTVEHYQRNLKEAKEAVAMMNQGVNDIMNEIAYLEDDEAFEEKMIRFHVRANSNSTVDQELKLYVKDAVINFVKPLLAYSEDIEETKEILNLHMDEIRQTAANIIAWQGYEYDVNVYFTKEQFPIKQYGDMTFPAGEYEALRIDIGEARGDNWWCVMYPPLCFIDATNAVVSKEAKTQFRDILTEEEYNALFCNHYSDEDVEITVKSKLVEMIKAWGER